jgi:hypothetical protein
MEMEIKHGIIEGNPLDERSMNMLVCAIRHARNDSYSELAPGSRPHSCTLPVFFWWMLPSSALVSERRYVPTTKWLGDSGQNCRQLGGWSRKTVVADCGFWGVEDMIYKL